MGNTTGILTPPPSITDTKSMLEHLRKIVKRLEELDSGLNSPKPSFFQNMQYKSITKEFVAVYTQITSKIILDEELESLLSRYNNIQIKWSRIYYPKGYSEPLLDK